MSFNNNNKPEGQVTLTQMLKALDKDVATGLERKIKKLSKKAQVKAPLDENKAKLLERKSAYAQVSKELQQWDPIVERQKNAKQLKFPLDQQPDVLPAASEAISELKPRNELERKVQDAIQSSECVLHDNKELSKAEEKYLKAISAEEAKERHLELQKMRVLLSSFAAKMRRQKAIKSKSYHRLLKQDRIKKHMRKVESSKDKLMDELELLRKLRAKERATLKHKNTGKWAKHAKFRAKYDDEARKAMIEQIGLSDKLRERPANIDSGDSSSETDDDSNANDDENDDDDKSVITDDDEEDASSVGDDEIERRLKIIREEERKQKEANINQDVNDRLIVNSHLTSDRMSKNKQITNSIKSTNKIAADELDEAYGQIDETDEEDESHRLMSEAFAEDDVVSEFKKAKEDLINEEQPKDLDLFLPGWGDWTGPGTKVNKRKKKRFQVKVKRKPRLDDKLGNVIISEEADSKISALQINRLPHAMRTEKRFERLMEKPIVATFVPQSEHREAIKPRVETKMGARIEPMSKSKLIGGRSLKWK